MSVFTEDVSAPVEERMWETVYIKRDEVKSWTVTKDGMFFFKVFITIFCISMLA